MIGFLAASCAFADTVVFLPGVSDASGANPAYQIAATHIRTDQALTTGGEAASFNFGGAKQLELGRTRSQISRALIRFDLASLAGRAMQITSARLTLTVRRSNLEPAQVAFPTTLTLRLFRLAPANAYWQAGSADGAAEAGSVCWNSKAALQAPWAGLPGCGAGGIDFEAVPAAVAIGHAAVYQPGDTFSFDFADPASLQDWVDHPLHNAGYLLTSDALESSPADGIQSIQFLSDEATDLAHRPSLTIDFQPASQQAQKSAADSAWMRMR